jgi:prevent-host-death family protein
MSTVAISHLRAHLPEYIEKTQKGEIFYITSHGKNLACLTPPVNVQNQAREKLRAIKAQCHVGDVITPINTQWDAMQ